MEKLSKQLTELERTSQQIEGHIISLAEPSYRELQWMLPKQLSSGGNY